MFLVSGPDLVVECCRSGLCGTFPALNHRSSAGFAEWMCEIEERNGEAAAPFGVNMIIHKSNPRLEEDMAHVVSHKVPLVITSLGAVSDLVKEVHSYGGLVFHDVISRRHAEKAAEAGVDGIIAVSAGAGGHTGSLSPFALVSEIREVFDGPIILSGSITHGRHVAAAQMMGADFGYIGSHFIAAAESLASAEQKAMMIGAHAKDIAFTDKVTGVGANFLKPSLEAAALPAEGHGELTLTGEARAWKTIWSAGHGIGATTSVRPAAEICHDLIEQYHAARKNFCA